MLAEPELDRRDKDLGYAQSPAWLGEALRNPLGAFQGRSSGGRVSRGLFRAAEYPRRTKRLDPAWNRSESTERETHTVWAEWRKESRRF